MKPDVVICVGGTPCFGWLSEPGDEDEANDIVITTDACLVSRYATVEEAMPRFNQLVAAHPRRQFRMMTITPLALCDATF